MPTSVSVGISLSNLVVTDLHFDRFRLGDLFLRQGHSQDAVVEIGLNMLGIHRVRNREVTYERAVASLEAMEAFVLLLGRELSLPLQG